MARSNLNFLLSVNPPIGQALPGRLLERDAGAFCVAVASRSPVREAEIKLGAVALQMGFADVVIRPNKSALEQTEERFNRVDMRDHSLALALARVFPLGVIHMLMAQEIRAYLSVVVRSIRHQVRVLSDLPLQDGLKRPVVNVGNMETTGSSITLDQGEDLVLMASATTFARALAARNVAVERFIGLNDLATSANRAIELGSHGFPDSVGHEPSRFVGDPEHAVQLMGRYAFLARGHQMEGQQPLVQRDMGTLEDRSHRYREVATAACALVQTWTVALTLKACHFLGLAAM